MVDTSAHLSSPSSSPLPPALSAAYERGRWSWALSRSALVAAVASPVVVAGGCTVRAVAFGAALVAIAVVSGWRSRGGFLGAAVGAAIAVVPVVVGNVLGAVGALGPGAACACAGGVCFSACGIACAGGAGAIGAIAGSAFVGLRVGRADFIVAAVVAAGVGTLVCPVAGVGSVVGAVVGVLAAAPPAGLVWAVWARGRRPAWAP